MNFNRIPRPRRAQGRVFERPAWVEKQSGVGPPTVVKRDNSGVGVTVLDRRGKAWPSSLWEGLGKHGSKGALGYPLRGWSKTYSGTGAGD
jgi:hypothetical protein